MIKPLFDSSKLKAGHRVKVDPLFGLSPSYSYVATVVEPTSRCDVLEGVPASRQMVVRPDGKRKTLVIDKVWITRKL